MNDRERLIKLLYELENRLSLANAVLGNGRSGTAMIEYGEVADYFIANGVTVRKHGQWVTTIYTTASKRGRIISNAKHTCSECGYSNGRKKNNYCPNCGARMDEGGTMRSFGERHKQISKREHYFEEASNKGIAQLLWEIGYDAYAFAMERRKRYFPCTTDGWIEWLQEAYDEPYKPHFERWREDNED